jgi:hypothetical protein
MGYAARVSLKHEYERFVEREIEEYKDRIPREAILKIADEAAQRLHRDEQITLNELVLSGEVDRIISARLRLPAYTTWMRRRRRLLETLRRPESWNLTESDAIVRNLPSGAGAHVLVAQSGDDRTALYFAANGCTVSAVEPDSHVIERILRSAETYGLTSRVVPCHSDVRGWMPGPPLAVVVCACDALEDLAAHDCAHVLSTLQCATMSGGVHLFGGNPSDLARVRASYAGWQTMVDPSGDRGQPMLVARKS